MRNAGEAETKASRKHGGAVKQGGTGVGRPALREAPISKDLFGKAVVTRQLLRAQIGNLFTVYSQKLLKVDPAPKIGKVHMQDFHLDEVSIEKAIKKKTQITRLAIQKAKSSFTQKAKRLKAIKALISKAKAKLKAEREEDIETHFTQELKKIETFCNSLLSQGGPSKSEENVRNESINLEIRQTARSNL